MVRDVVLIRLVLDLALHLMIHMHAVGHLPHAHVLYMRVPSTTVGLDVMSAMIWLHHPMVRIRLLVELVKWVHHARLAHLLGYLSVHVARLTLEVVLLVSVHFEFA